MAPPKSKKLVQEEQGRIIDPGTGVAINVAVESPADDGPVRIRPITLYNDYIAILRTETKSTIDMGDGKFKNEGFIVGRGPNAHESIKIGDYVMFSDKSPVVPSITSASPPYVGKSVTIIAERSLICKVPTAKEWVQVD